jgi:hypothetical protein
MKQVGSRSSCWSLHWLIIRPWTWKRHSSETSIDFQRTTRHYIPEDRNLYNHLCENLKSYMPSLCLSECTCMYVCILFLICIYESIRHRSMPSEAEHSNSRNWGLQTTPWKRNGDFDCISENYGHHILKQKCWVYDGAPKCEMSILSKPVLPIRRISFGIH